MAEAADEIHADICENALDERGVFTQHYETDALDASMLLMPLVRFLPPTDERIRATVLAIADELTEDGLVLRYRTEETDDGLSGEEGTFTICSFWLVSALCEIGELERARELCERLLCYASPLGLYAEEIDPRTGRHLGNFPQAFTHLALINAVMHVIHADEALEGAQPLSFGHRLARCARASESAPTAKSGMSDVTGRLAARSARPARAPVLGREPVDRPCRRRRGLSSDPVADVTPGRRRPAPRW